MWDTNPDPFSSHPILQISTSVRFLEAVGHWFSHFQLVASPDQLGHGQHLPVRLQSNALVRAVGFLRGLHSSWGWFLWLPQGSMVMLCYQHQIHMVFLADEGLISLLAPWKAPASSMGKSLPSQSFNQSINPGKWIKPRKGVRIWHGPLSLIPSPLPKNVWLSFMSNYY